MKYIDIEKLKAVIRRRIKKLDNDRYISVSDKTTRIAELHTFDRFIDSLQQEQPEVDLEEEIKNYTESLYHELFVCQHTVDEFDWDDIAETIDMSARHFFGLGLKAGKE